MESLVDTLMYELVEGAEYAKHDEVRAEVSSILRVSTTSDGCTPPSGTSPQNRRQPRPLPGIRPRVTLSTKAGQD